MDQALAKNIRQSILRASHRSGHGHIPTCFSIVESLIATYRFMDQDPQNPAAPDRDMFVLSKGHASLAQYCTLAHLGYFEVAEVDRFGAHGSTFGCHPDRLKVPGVEVSTGSLGHGIGVAVGMALAAKKQAAATQTRTRQVVTLIGDGEANEGSVWEAVMVAADQALDNLKIIYDANKSQIRCLQLPDPAARFTAFGCAVQSVDGHDVAALLTALNQPTDRPSVIVADTQKGYGCQTLVDEMFAWHRRSPDADELALLMDELDAR